MHGTADLWTGLEISVKQQQDGVAARTDVTPLGPWKFQEGGGDSNSWWELCWEEEGLLFWDEFYSDPFMEIFVVVLDI